VAGCNRNLQGPTGLRRGKGPRALSNPLSRQATAVLRGTVRGTGGGRPITCISSSIENESRPGILDRHEQVEAKPVADAAGAKRYATG
jgi:hypothetical protein